MIRHSSLIVSVLSLLNCYLVFIEVCNDIVKFVISIKY